MREKTLNRCPRGPLNVIVDNHAITRLHVNLTDWFPLAVRLGAARLIFLQGPSCDTASRLICELAFAEQEASWDARTNLEDSLVSERIPVTPPQIITCGDWSKQPWGMGCIGSRGSLRRRICQPRCCPPIRVGSERPSPGSDRAYRGASRTHDRGSTCTSVAERSSRNCCGLAWKNRPVGEAKRAASRCRFQQVPDVQHAPSRGCRVPKFAFQYSGNPSEVCRRLA